MNIKWEIHPSGFGFASSSIANGSGLISILGGCHMVNLSWAYGTMKPAVPEEIELMP